MKLGQHFFRREYGKLVATLSRRFGMQHITEVEDAVQSALMTALESWTLDSEPDNPPAWLFRVAYNNVLGELRQRAGHRRLLEQVSPDADAGECDPEIVFAGELQDDLLRMLFACCAEEIPLESQLVFALHTLCGFSVGEIAIRLFATEANVYKRLSRARIRLRKTQLATGELEGVHYASRLAAVHSILYLLFTEGYLSSHSEVALRRELCDEAIRLAKLLVAHPVGQTPDTFALLALMHFHVARMTAREDATGGLLLLEEQDRRLWDQSEIGTGMEWLAKSAQGNRFSRYHAEAGIAVEHCLAPSFGETRWDRVAELYSLLESVSPSVVHRLNRAVAVAEWKGPAEGLSVIKGFEAPRWLVGSYLWSAVLADLHRRCGEDQIANDYLDLACESAPTPAIRRLLRRRFQAGQDAA